MEPTIIDTFEIPEDIAKELSSLLAKQSIRERLLVSVIGKPEYETLEASLIPIVEKIDSFKNMITLKYVPEKYRSDRFIWNYPGWEVSGTSVQIGIVG